MLYAVAVIKIDFRMSLLCLFGGDHHYSVGSPRTVNSRSRSIFQDIDGFYIVRIQVPHAAAYRHPIDHIQRRRVVDGTHTTYQNGYITARRTGILHDLYPRHLSGNSLHHIGSGILGDLSRTDGRDSTRNVFLTHRAITHYHHFIQCRHIFLQYHFDKSPSGYVYFRSDIANIRNN